MNKNEIFVLIANKKEAKRARIVLESLGEKLFTLFYEPRDTDDGYNSLVYEHEGWIVGKDKGKTQITLKQLIELLVRQNEIPKEYLPSEMYAENSKTPLQKIAVKVENEKEFNALMKYYDTLGYSSPSESNLFAYETIESDKWLLVTFEDDYKYLKNLNHHNYKIITFADFAKEHNIKLPILTSEDGVDLYEDDEYFRVYKEYDKWQLSKGTFPTYSEMTAINANERCKAFHTKEAALKWIEEQKPKEILLFEDTPAPTTVSLTGLKAKHISYGYEYTCTSQELEKIWEAYQSLKNVNNAR